MVDHNKTPAIIINRDDDEGFSPIKKPRLSFRPSNCGRGDKKQKPRANSTSGNEDDVFGQEDKENAVPRDTVSLKRKGLNLECDDGWVIGLSPPSPSATCHEAVPLESPVRKKLQSLGVRKCQETKKDVVTLGRGGYGTVVLGSYAGSKVAVKVLGNKSFANEMIACKLDHPNIVKVLRVFPANRDESFNLVVMECVGHYNLKDVIHNQSGKLTEPFVHRASSHLASALSYCHGNGIVHLDVKPANVLVIRKENASSVAFKLADFGFSTRLDDADRPANLGTPGYQAPEILRKGIRHRLTAKSDVYSYGVLLWQLLAKQSDVYPGVHPHTVIFQVATNPRYNPEVVSKRSSEDVPSRWKELYRTCWSNDVSARPGMSQIVKLLKLLNAQGPSGNSLSPRGYGKVRRNSLRL